MIDRIQKHLFFPLSLVTTLTLSNTVYAAGFFNYMQSARTAGTAGSLSTINEEDASAVFYNPAALPKIKNHEFVLTTPIGQPSVNFTNQSTLNPLSIPVSGNNRAKEDIFFLPALALASRIDSDTTVGLGFYIPFGQVREYDPNWVGRYHVTRSELTTISINPSIRYDITSAFSLGGSFFFEKNEVALTSAIDFGSACIVTLGAGCPLAPMTADGEQSLTGDDWQYGFSLGMLYRINDDMKFGMAYRSKVKHTLKGIADFNLPASALFLTAGGTYVDTPISMEMTLPEIYSIGFGYSLNEKFNIYMDASHTKWSRMDQLLVDYVNPLQPDLTLENNWKDVWRFAIGGDYKISDYSYLSFGIAYDESPIPSHRVGAILPENDSLLFAVGYGFELSKDLSIDLTFVRYHYNDFTVDDSTATSGRLSGKYDLENQAIGLQANWSF